MALPQSDFQKACLQYKINWPGTGNDGKTVAQRLDQAQAPVSEDRIRQLIAEALQKLPAPLSEARVKQLIAEAGQDVVVPRLLQENGDPILLEEDVGRLLLERNA